MGQNRANIVFKLSQVVLTSKHSSAQLHGLYLYPRIQLRLSLITASQSERIDSMNRGVHLIVVKRILSNATLRPNCTSANNSFVYI